MPKFRVLLTDYAWPSLDLERAGLAEADAELLVAERSDAESLAGLAASCQAIMTNWANVPEQVIAGSYRGWELGSTTSTWPTVRAAAFP
jgi:D-3-phosphoglycerate dehydrogenase / 2-oxoglutarate reductase